jgi:hypothetical protein
VTVLAVFAAADWVWRSPDDERTLRDFAIDLDRGDGAAARTHLKDPTIVAWPTYWSFLNLEHISPFGDRLDALAEFQHALGTRTDIGACERRPTSVGEPGDYDTWLFCSYVLRDALSQRLEGPTGSTHGQLGVGFKDGLIRTVFVIRADRPAVLSEFRTWASTAYPDRYAGLFSQPPVLQLDVPIIGLVVTDYNGATAEVLIEFADAYVAAGFPPP